MKSRPCCLKHIKQYGIVRHPKRPGYALCCHKCKSRLTHHKGRWRREES